MRGGDRFQCARRDARQRAAFGCSWRIARDWRVDARGNDAASGNSRDARPPRRRGTAWARRARVEIRIHLAYVGGLGHALSKSRTVAFQFSAVRAGVARLAPECEAATWRLAPKA